ncbi:HAD-IA family hydrolase [Parashewanella spongiae]|nr:HAD-IA family hydrolase [Parashewanella spongiae]MCL1077767.1 HAD-IA family hydrolase [Parashewanella spongiae]
MMAKLLFDLDGTLSDPIDGITNCINYSLKSFGYPSLSKAEVAKYIGPPLDMSFIQITGQSNPVEIQTLVQKYRQRFSEVGFSGNRLYDDIPLVLETLQKQNVILGVCTSKPRHFAQQILELFKLDAYFEFISGGDIGIQKSQQIASLKQQGAVDSSTIMIGDRGVDISAAKQNGLRSAAVLWGYGSLAELTAESANFIVHRPIELLKLNNKL